MSLPDPAARACAAALLVSAILLAAGPARAQSLPGRPETRLATAPTPVPAQEPAPEAPDSPRASARSFLDLAGRKGDFKGAARYLTLPDDQEGRGPELARRMRAVLERHVDLDALSPLPEGSREDGLPSGVDSVGTVPDGRGGQDPVFVVRTRDAAGPYWAFSRQTVSRIDGWYDALADRWVRDWMPDRLQRHGPLGLTAWQWLAVPILLVLVLAVGRILGALTTAFLHRVFRRTPTGWDEQLLERTAPALRLLWAVAAAAVLLPWLALLPDAHRFVRSLLGGVATLAVVWALWRSVDVWAAFFMERPWATESPSTRSLISVTRNFAKVFVALGGLVATLAAFGYPVATVLAGLGIGGLALAFGAQKTVENLFGSVALAADQPLRVGDLVKVEDFTGTVERIGMRSTQIRTPDRTLITVPNGKLSDMRIEDFASRDRILFKETVGLAYGTSREQIERVVAGMEKVLRDHPAIWPDSVAVHFAGLGASSLDVAVMAWFRTSSYDVFLDCRQEVLLGFMRVVETEGSSFAFPTRTVHLVMAPTPPSEGSAEGRPRHTD
jgi:MscS family membrane protein